MANYHFDTVAIHGGHDLDSTNSRAVPIYQTTSYVFEDSAQAADLFSLAQEGHIYSRISNPTVEILEKRIAELEGGTAAVATASGQSAITLALLTLAKPGDEIISSVNIYGGTYNLFANTLKRAGIHVIFVPADDPAAFEQHITEKTKAIFAETVGNPSLHVLDIEALAEVAHRHHVPLVIDSTFTPPYMTRPIEHGADIVVHSATKWLGGHGTSVAGVIIESGNFDWASGRFPEFVEPEPSFQGVKFFERFGEKTFTARVRNLLLRDYGPSLSPMSAFLILLGLETLHLRMQRHNENAEKLANYLEQHPAVDWVLYPGLESHPSHENAKKYMKNGYGSMVVLGIKGSRADAAKVLDETKLWSHLANVGDAKSLIIHPASTTHQQLDAEALRKTGVTETLIRLSVGIESYEDIKNDLAQAIEKAVALKV